MRCWLTLEDGREVLADCVDDAQELAGMLHMRVKREDLLEDIRAIWERGLPGFEYIQGYFGKSQVRFKDED